MGGHPWFYFVAFEPDINSALQKLRRREFEAGRYNPAMDFPEFPVNEDAPAPGAQHDSIDEAIEDADADGTRSILDMMTVAESADFNAVAPVPDDELMELFGTAKPSREMIEESDDLYEKLERGQGVYIICYRDEQPSEIFFAGYSFD